LGEDLGVVALGRVVAVAVVVVESGLGGLNVGDVGPL
jgi:hypothetical protein